MFKMMWSKSVLFTWDVLRYFDIYFSCLASKFGFTFAESLTSDLRLIKTKRGEVVIDTERED